jgi:DNA-binding IclR family transcriptional regulator
MEDCLPRDDVSLDGQGPHATATAVEKCLLVLRILSQPGPHSLSGIVKASSLNKTTVIRILDTLERQSFIERTAGRGVRFGPETLILAASAARQPQLRHLAAEGLVRLVKATGDTAILLIRSELDVVCMQREEGSFPLRAGYFVEGRRLPLGAGSPGVAWLAALPAAETPALLQANAPRLAAMGIRMPRIEQDIELARTRGYAISTNTVSEGTGGISVAVRSHEDRPIAVLTITALIDRLLAREAHISELLAEEARRLGETANNAGSIDR